MLGLIVFSGIALYSGSAELFQGRMSKSSNPLPAYDENKCYDSDGGKNYDEAGTVFGKISRSKSGSKSDFCSSGTALTEYYCDGKFIKNEEYACDNGCSDGVCKKISANLSDKLDTLVIVDTDSYNITEKDVEEFFKNYKQLPEYIVFLTKDGTTINGGFGGGTTYYWLNPSMGSFYDSESSNKFCMEFPNPSEEDNFYLENPLYFSASTMVHELLHFYGENDNLDHFGTYVCNEAVDNMLEELEVSKPFKTLSQEYAVMCPNVWEKFKNSQQSCD